MQWLRRKDYLPFEILDQKSSVVNINVSEDDHYLSCILQVQLGLPKGAIGSHLGAIHSSMNYEQVLKLNQETKTLIAVPLFHVTGLIGQLFHMVRVGGTSVIMSRYRTEEYIRLTVKKKYPFYLTSQPSIS